MFSDCVFTTCLEQKTSYKSKRKFRGNKYVSVASAEAVTFNQTSTPETSLPKTDSSSSKKLSFIDYDNYETSGSGNCIFYVSLLSDMMKQFVKCKFCDNENCIELCTLDEGKKGLAVKTELKCNVCFKSVVFYNSFLCNNKMYDINIKIVYAMRSIGSGLSTANVFVH